MGNSAAEPERKEAGDHQGNDESKHQAAGHIRSPLERREEQRRRSARGNSQGIGKAQRPRIREIQLRVRSKAFDAVMQSERAHVPDRFPEASTPHCKTEGHDTAREGGENQKPGNQRHPGNGSDGGHQFDVTCAHSARQPEDEKENTADKSGEGCESELLPSTEN